MATNGNESHSSMSTTITINTNTKSRDVNAPDDTVIDIESSSDDSFTTGSSITISHNKSNHNDSKDDILCEQCHTPILCGPLVSKSHSSNTDNNICGTNSDALTSGKSEVNDNTCKKGNVNINNNANKNSPIAYNGNCATTAIISVATAITTKAITKADGDANHNGTNDENVPRTSIAHRPLRVKHLGKRKYELLRPFILPSSFHSYSSSLSMPMSTLTPLLLSSSVSNNTKAIGLPLLQSNDDHHPRQTKPKLEPKLEPKHKHEPEHNQPVQSEIQIQSQNIDQVAVAVSLQQQEEPSLVLQPPSSDSDCTSNNNFTLEYVPSDIPNFWHCPNCIHLPFSKRPKHSVIFHATINDTPRTVTTSMNETYSNVTTRSRSPVPSSDTHRVIAIHSYLCELKCDKIKSKQNGIINCDNAYISDSSSTNILSDNDESEDEDVQWRKSQRLERKQEQKARGGPGPNNKQGRKMKKNLTLCNNNNNQSETSTGTIDSCNTTLSSNIQREMTTTMTIKKKKRGKPTTFSNLPSSYPRGNSAIKPKKTKKYKKKVSANHTTTSETNDTNATKRKIIKIDIPPNDNGLIDMSNDTKITASIDYYIMSQVKRCSYNRSNDKIAYLRQKPLPEKFPGVQCLYCDKQWFFNSSIQLATGLPKIEGHLTGVACPCESCPGEVKKNIIMAKDQEEYERNELGLVSGRGQVTRRQYAKVVIERFNLPKLD